MKIVYINVASRTDRRDFMEGQLQALGLSAERIEAVTPADLTREQIDRYCDASRGAFLMPLELCCGLSHLRALRSVLVSGADRAIILEDDAVLSSRLPAFLQDFEQLSLACDLLRLETTFERTRLLASQMPACGGIAIQIPYSWASGSGAYLISRRGAQLAVASEELLRKPADRAMCNPYEPIPRRLVVVEAVAKRGVQRAEHLGAVGLLGRDQHPDRTPAGLEQLAVLLRQVVLALVQHRQAHDMPGHRDRADLLHLADPAGGDPGPRADRVEPEVDVLRYLGGWLMRGHVQSQTPGISGEFR